MTGENEGDGVYEKHSGFRYAEQMGPRQPSETVYSYLAQHGGPVDADMLDTELAVAKEKITSALAWLHDQGLIMRADSDRDTTQYIINSRHKQLVATDRYIQSCSPAEIAEKITEEANRAEELSKYFESDSPEDVDPTDAETHDDIHERLDRHSKWIGARARLQHLRRAQEMLESDVWETPE